MQKMNLMDWIALVLVIVGGLNWGLVGAFDFDLVATVFGEGATLANVVYILVGISALYLAVTAPMKGRSTTAG